MGIHFVPLIQIMGFDPIKLLKILLEFIESLPRIELLFVLGLDILIVKLKYTIEPL